MGQVLNTRNPILGIDVRGESPILQDPSQDAEGSDHLFPDVSSVQVSKVWVRALIAFFSLPENERYLEEGVK